MKTKKLKSDKSMGTGTGISSIGAAIDAAIASPSAAPLVVVAKSELVRACGAGLVAYAPRDWSPNRKQWQPVAILRGTRGAGRGYDAQSKETPAAPPVVNVERLAFEAARAQSERAAIAAELDRLRAVRVAALASGAGELVAMAPLGARKGSKSRALIDRGGEAGEDEARQCEVERLQRIERDPLARLAHAAAKLGERCGHGWFNRKSYAREIETGKPLDETLRPDAVECFRCAGIEAVMSGEVDGLLGARRFVKAARKAAGTSIYRGGNRDGKDPGLDDKLHGSIALPGAPRSSAPDQSSGAGLRPSVVGELATWGEQVRKAAFDKIAAASTPAAKGNATAAAARRVALIQGLFDYVQGGASLDPDLLAEFFDGGPEGGLTQKGHKRIQRMRKALF